MRYLYLHGALSQFGGPFGFDVPNALLMVQALASQRPEFEQMLRQGRYRLLAGPLSRPRPVYGTTLTAPLHARNLHIYPALQGASKGRGKMVLGLTLLGLSFVPGVSAGLTQFATTGTGSSSLGASIGKMGVQLIGKTGQYLMAKGAIDAISPQYNQPAGVIDPAIVSVPESDSEGHALPLIYGQVRVDNPLFIQTGLSIETEQL